VYAYLRETNCAIHLPAEVNSCGDFYLRPAFF